MQTLIIFRYALKHRRDSRNVISINNIVMGSMYTNHRRERNSKAARLRESVSSALVKAFQVFHPTNFELLQR